MGAPLPKHFEEGPRIGRKTPPTTKHPRDAKPSFRGLNVSGPCPCVMLQRSIRDEEATP